MTSGGRREELAGLEGMSPCEGTQPVGTTAREGPAGPSPQNSQGWGWAADPGSLSEPQFPLCKQAIVRTSRDGSKD